MELKKMLSLGYFPKELPLPFYTEDFANFIHDKIVLNRSFVSRPCTHNLARPGNQRRVLSISHPQNFCNLAKVISDNWTSIETHFLKSNISKSIPIIDDKETRCVKTRFEGSKLPIIRAEIRGKAKYILRIDISRFYHSIYTHSIPWALNTKAIAKSMRSGGLGNDLDLFLRNGQDSQTLGIPVGPDTSLIISEILGTAIDEKLEKDKMIGYRYVDDFEFVFYSRSEAEQALPKIESILQEFELALNVDKTFIDELPVSIDKYWTSIIRNFDFSDEVSTSKLIHYFDTLFALYKENKREPVLGYGISRLSNADIRDEIIEDLLLQCVSIEPGTLVEVLHYCDTTGLKFNDDKFKKVLFDLIKYHGAMKHGSEVAWALWTCIWNDYKIPVEVAESIMFFDDSIVALLGCHAYSKKLIDESILKYWKTLMTSDSLKDGHWLLAYEADLKKWLPSADSTNHVNKDPFFKILKKNKISFYRLSTGKIISEKQNIDSYGVKRYSGYGREGKLRLDMDDDLPF
ncbi:MAG TPA: RNA-directed DNA polymerase [Cytophagaceae bacterium]|jgi:hypothetical protein|nr:RNA-directed DNA polymerase [Cytophagaceae bacterium]